MYSIPLSVSVLPKKDADNVTFHQNIGLLRCHSATCHPVVSRYLNFISEGVG
jgi:hypothetical protein